MCCGDYPPLWARFSSDPIMEISPQKGGECGPGTFQRSGNLANLVKFVNFVILVKLAKLRDVENGRPFRRPIMGISSRNAGPALEWPQSRHALLPQRAPFRQRRRKGGSPAAGGAGHGEGGALPQPAEPAKSSG